MSKRRKPRGGWSSSPNQWKTPQSTRKGPKGCELTALILIGGFGGIVVTIVELVSWLT